MLFKLLIQSVLLHSCLGISIYSPPVDSASKFFCKTSRSKTSKIARKIKKVQALDISFTKSCTISSSCKFSAETLLSNYITESSGVYWIGESVLQHSYLSLLNHFWAYRVNRGVLKNGGEYCTVHGTSIKVNARALNFFMIRSQGIYDQPVNDTVRWIYLKEKGVHYTEQFVAHDKYELSGCFKNKNLETKIQTFFNKWRTKDKIVYIQLGLWDVCFTANDIIGFELKLRSLLAYLQSEAMLFVGLMTAMHNSLPRHQKRYNNTVIGRVEPYNKVISKICKELHIPLLEETYELTLRNPLACLDGVHYNELISFKLAKSIKNFICSNLKRHPMDHFLLL